MPPPSVLSDRIIGEHTVALAAEPEGLLAARLVELGAAAGGAVHVARSEARAARLARAARALEPGLPVTLLPAWDCLPYDRSSPSRAVMGARMAALRALSARPGGPGLVLASLDAATQRLPPPEALAVIAFRRGDAFDPERVGRQLEALGYLLDERVDEPGEAALHGAVLDVFPAEEGALPCRVEHAEGRIASIRRYDPLTQRSAGRGRGGAARRRPPSSCCPRMPAPPHAPGIEHGLADFRPRLVTLFELVPGAAVVLDPEVEAMRPRARGGGGGRLPHPPALLPPGEDARPPPRPTRSSSTRRPGRGAGRPPRRRPRRNRPSCPGAPSPASSTRATRRRPSSISWRRRARPGRAWPWPAAAPPRAGAPPARGGTAGTAAAALPGLARLPGGAARRARRAPRAARGRLPGGGGHRRRARRPPPRPSGAGGAASRGLPGLAGPGLRPGDAVIHLDHGLGALRGVEAVTVGRGDARTAFASTSRAARRSSCRSTRWTGSGATARRPEAVTLDRLGRRILAEAARGGRGGDRRDRPQPLRLAREAATRTAPALRPPGGAYDRFAARFPYALTADQAAAIDGGAGRPRLRPADGPARLRRCRLRQDRGRAARGRRGGAGREAGRGARADDRAGAPAPDTFRRRFAGFGVGGRAAALPPPSAGGGEAP